MGVDLLLQALQLDLVRLDLEQTATPALRLRHAIQNADRPANALTDGLDPSILHVHADDRFHHDDHADCDLVY
jgi:hypothetical protein